MSSKQFIEPQDYAQPVLFALDLRDVRRAISRSRWVILACVIVVTAAAVAWTLEQEKVYAARATLIVEGSLPKVLGESFDVEEGAGAGRSQVFYNTQYGIMRSRAVLLETAERLGLPDDEGFVRDYGLQAIPPERRLKACEGILRSNLEVIAPRDSALVDLVVEDFEPDRAATIANAIAQVYIDQTLEQRLSTSRGASDWLDQRLEEFSRRLDASQAALSAFKKENMLVSVSVEERRNMTTARLSALNDQLIEVRGRIIGLESERDVITKASRDSNPSALTTIPRVGENSLVKELRLGIVDLDRRIAELSGRYGPKHPSIVALIEQQSEVRRLLEDEVAVVVQTLENELAELNQREQRLEAEMRTETDKAIELNNLGLEYARLSRDVGTNHDTYRSLLKRQTETDLSGQLESHYARLLELAEPMNRAVRPSMALNATLGVILGLILGLGIAIGTMLLDGAVHSQEDIEERLGLSFMGILPSITSRMVPASGRDLYIAQNPESSVAEYARSLRTNLLFMSSASDSNLKHLLLTSAGPAEGKTTTLIALGTTMALAGNRVLLVDTDLRRPRLHSAFDLSNHTGLTSLLLGDPSLSFDKMIRRTSVENLDLLPCGPRPPNPSELLHSPDFQEVLRRVGDRYDRILFDSPPLNAVTDAAILAQQVEGTVLIIKASHTSFEAARLATRRLFDVQANLLGVVLNQVDTSRGATYKNYYYYRAESSYGRRDTRKAV